MQRKATATDEGEGFCCGFDGTTGSDWAVWCVRVAECSSYWPVLSRCRRPSAGVGDFGLRLLGRPGRRLVVSGRLKGEHLRVLTLLADEFLV